MAGGRRDGLVGVALAGWRAVAVAGLATLALAACTASEREVVTQDIVSRTPWQAPEEATYRILRDDEVIGQGLLRIEEQGDSLLLTQEFDFPARGFQDTVAATVDGQTLKPLRVERVISGPEGDRRWEVHYLSGIVEVRQTGGGDQRTDQLNLPQHAYDSWSEIFLWRTIDFRLGYRASYNGVLTAVLARPDSKLVTLQVVGRETIQVPAGQFEAWRLERLSGGRKQVAWYSSQEGRLLIRYDNGELVFELEEMPSGG